MNIESLGIATTNDSNYAALLKQCYEHAKESKHPSTHNAALLVDNNSVVLYGVNNLPKGVEEKQERFEGNDKHKYLNHAEVDVIFKAANQGVKINGLTMVMPWLPCIPCANAIISSGVKKLVVHKQMVERTADKWKDELKEAVQLLKEAKVEVLAFDGIVGAEAYMHSEKWDA